MSQTSFLMKQNITGSIKAFLSTVLLFILSVAIRLFYSKSLYRLIIYPDSVEYLSAADKLMKFEIDINRVPVYPLFILIADKTFPLFGQGPAIVALQVILSSLGTSGVFLISNILFKNCIKSFAVSLYCLVSVCLINWDFLILTESLAIFLIILLVLFYLLFIKTKANSFLLLTLCVCGIMIFLKPFYILLPIGLFILVLINIILDKAKWKVIYIAVISLSIIYSGVAVYSFINLKQNNYYGTSSVSIINKMGKILQYRMYDLGDNERIKAYIRAETKLKGEETLEPVDFIGKYGLGKNNYAEVSDFASNIINKHPLTYIKRTIKFAASNEFLNSKAFVDYNMRNYKMVWPEDLFYYTNNISKVNSFRFLFCLLLIEWLLIIFNYIRKRSVDWYWLFINVIILYQVSMSIIGAHGEYNRLIAPVYILIYLIVFKYIFYIVDIPLRYVKNRQRV